MKFRLVTMMVITTTQILNNSLGEDMSSNYDVLLLPHK